MMGGRTPHLDKLACSRGASLLILCRGQAVMQEELLSFGELPIRTGLTTVGQAGATIGMPSQAPTIANSDERNGLFYGTIRQESSWWQKWISSDSTWIWWVLWLSLSFRRYGRSFS